jgi:hypothetical protein
MSTEDTADGWRAIELTLARLYPDSRPHHFGTVMRWSEGGPDPLDGVSVYPNNAGGPHWHYVSFGLSEPGVRDSDNAETGGWGIELTFRARRGKEQEPPKWPTYLMQEIARYVIEDGSPFDEYHYVDRAGPWVQGQDTTMRGIVFFRDPALGTVETPNGRVQFLQMFGVTQIELEAFKSDRYLAVFETMKTRNEWLVTDLARASYFE